MKTVFLSQFKKDWCNRCVYKNDCSKGSIDSPYCETDEWLKNLDYLTEVLYGKKVKIIND